MFTATTMTWIDEPQAKLKGAVVNNTLGTVQLLVDTIVDRLPLQLVNSYEKVTLFDYLNEMM